MLIEIYDEKVREYLKNIYQDFKDGLVHTEETILIRDSLRKVVHNNKMNLVSGGLIYEYINSQLENDCDYYIQWNLESQSHIPVEENIKIVKEIYQEWVYLDSWFQERFILKTSDYGLSIVSFKERV